MDIVLTFDDEHIASVVLDDIQDSHPYCPHHPHEGPYEDTDLATYAAELGAYQRDRQTSDSAWAQDWETLDDDRLAALIQFVDFRRWKALNRAGEVVEGVPLPPELDLQSRKFAFRPGFS